MAEVPPGIKLGEARDAKYEVVSLAGDISAGDFLKVTGQEADGTIKVQKQNGTTKPYYFATHAGKQGAYARVVCKGYIAGKAGSALDSGFGKKLGIKDSEIVKVGTASALDTPGMLQWTKNAAANDIVLAWFDPRGIDP